MATPENTAPRETYEVSIPPDHAETLWGVARELGWDVRRIDDNSPVVHSDKIITPDTLDILSRDTWESNIYGQAALGIVELARTVPAPGIYRRHGSGLYLAMHGIDGDIRLDPASDSIDDIERAAHYAMAQSQLRLPWEVGRFTPDDSLIADDSFRSGRLYDIECERITAGKLKAYLRHKRFDRHALHGTLGKAIDVLNLAAGVTTPDQTGPANYDRQFISVPTLRARISQAGLDKSHGAHLVTAIADLARTQLRDGQPAACGEIIFEGPVRVRQFRNIRFEQVAIESLLSVAKTKKPHSRLHHFLMEEFGDRT